MTTSRFSALPNEPAGAAARPALPRRRLVLLAAGAAAGLAGCGFQLRQAPNFAFRSIFVTFAENSSLGTEFRRVMAANGSVEVVFDPQRINQADVILDVLQDQRERAVLSYNSSGGVREFQLRLRFRFRLRNQAGVELIPSSEILVQRDMSYSETVALAKEAEEAFLYRDMQSDVVQQLMRRLAAVR